MKYCHTIKTGPKRGANINCAPGRRISNAIFQLLTQAGSNKLVIHFHRGLVPRSSRCCDHDQNGDRSIRKLRPSGDFIWEKGLQETTFSNITQVGELGKALES